MSIDSFCKKLYLLNTKDFGWGLEPRNLVTRPGVRHLLRLQTIYNNSSELYKGSSKDADLCPLEVVHWAETGTLLRARDPVLRKRLYLDFFDCQKIIDASDENTGHDPELRARLLEACGLAAEQ